jgi:hypothetical protein
MVDAVFNFDVNDKGTPKIRRIKQEADKAANSVGNIQQVMKLGGGLAEGGIFGRLAEKGGGIGRIFASAGAGMGMLAGAALVAGVGLNAMAAASERAVSSAKEQVTWQQRLTSALEDAGKARAGVAAGGVGQAASMRQLIALGGGIGQVRKTAGQGVDYNDAMAGEIAMMKMDPRQREWMRHAALMMSQTGVSGFSDSVKALGQTKGNLEAAMLNQLGLRPTAANRAMVKGMIDRTQLFRGGNQAAMLNITNAVAQSGMVAAAQGNDLLSGATTKGIAQQNRAALDPQSIAIEGMAKEAENVGAQLDAAAKAQWRLMAMVKDLCMALGMSEGSEAVKAHTYRRNHRMTVDDSP